LLTLAIRWLSFLRRYQCAASFQFVFLRYP
jgi:hypothetical protein